MSERELTAKEKQIKAMFDSTPSAKPRAPIRAEPRKAMAVKPVKPAKTDPAKIGEGLHYGLSFEEYVRVRAINASILKQKTPAHMNAYRMGLLDKKPTDAMALGSLVDAMLFEPGTVDTAFAFWEGSDKRKSGWKAFKKANSSAHCMSETERAHASQMVDALKEDKSAGDLLRASSGSQVMALWLDERSGLWCKALLDTYIPGVVVDLKTTTDADDWSWRGKCKSFRHPLQAAFYLRGVEQITGEVHGFVWIVQETSPPYVVQCYRLEDVSQAYAIDEIDAALRNYAEGIESGEWPGYGGGIKDSGYPTWMTKRD